MLSAEFATMIAITIDSFGQGGLLFIAFGVLFAGIGVVRIVQQRRFIARATRAGGTVLALQERESASTDGPSTLLFPVVRFQTAAGEEIVFESAIGARPSPFRVGHPATVAYDPHNPHDARIATGCFLYGVSVVFIALGVFFVLMGAFFVVIQRFIDQLP